MLLKIENKKGDKKNLLKTKSISSPKIKHADSVSIKFKKYTKPPALKSSEKSIKMVKQSKNGFIIKPKKVKMKRK